MPLSQARRRLIQRLLQRHQRRKEGCFLVEGVRAATAALRAGADVRFVVTSPRLATLDRDERLAEVLSRARCDVVVVDDGEIESLTDTVTPQGILLVCDQPDLDLEGLSAVDNGILVADAVQDPTNLGSMIRTAAALGLDAVVALDGTVDPWNAKVVRGAAGGHFLVRVVGCAAESLLAWAAAHDVGLVAAAADGTDVAGFRPPDRWALLIGNEAAGVRELLLAAAPHRVGVPIRAEAESLNAGVAAAILAYELRRAGNAR